MWCLNWNPGIWTYTSSEEQERSSEKCLPKLTSTNSEGTPMFRKSLFYQHVNTHSTFSHTHTTTAHPRITLLQNPPSLTQFQLQFREKNNYFRLYPLIPYIITLSIYNGQKIKYTAHDKRISNRKIIRA